MVLVDMRAPSLELLESVLVGESGADEVVGVGLVGVELSDDLAVAHDQDPVAQRQQLLGFTGTPPARLLPARGQTAWMIS